MAPRDDDYDDNEVSGFDHTAVAGGNMFSYESDRTEIGGPGLYDASDRTEIAGSNLFGSADRSAESGFTGMLDPTDRASGAMLAKAGATLQFNDRHREEPDDLDEESEPFSQTSVVPVTSDDLDAVAIGSAIDGRFRITGVLGEGGMGKVYQAVQTSINREVAIKVVKQEFTSDPELRARFEREARLISSFTHPNIVRLVDYGESAGRLYLAMEFVNGRPLTQLFGRKQVQPRFALDMARQVSSALIEAHAKGVVHRDLKPDNILVSRIADGSVQYKVLDFGVARTSASDLTAAGSVCGTPQYMAPEQARGMTVTPASDLYAVGAMLFEMLCGRLPFVENSPVKLMIRHVQDPAPRVREFAPHVPQDVDDLVNALLQKSPDARPGSSEQLCEKIDAIMARHGWATMVRLPAGPLNETTASWIVDPNAPKPAPVPTAGPIPGLMGNLGGPDPVEAQRRKAMIDTVDEDSHWLGNSGSSVGLDGRSSGSDAHHSTPDGARDFSDAVLDLPKPAPAPAPVLTPAPHAPMPAPVPLMVSPDPTVTTERPRAHVASTPTPTRQGAVSQGGSGGTNKVNAALGIVLALLIVATIGAAFVLVIKPKLGASAAEAINATGDAKAAFAAIAKGGWEVGHVVPSDFGNIKLQSGKVSREGVTLSVSVYDCPTGDDIKNVFGTTVLPAMAYHRGNTVVRIEPVGEAPRADIEQALGFVSSAIPGGELSNTALR